MPAVFSWNLELAVRDGRLDDFRARAALDGFGAVYLGPFSGFRR